MKTRALSLILAAILLMTVLVGCAQSTEHVSLEYCEVKSDQNKGYIYTAFSPELVENSSTAVTLRLYVGLDSIFADSYNENLENTLYIRLRNKYNDTKMILVEENVNSKDGFFIPDAGSKTIVKEYISHKLNDRYHYTTVTMPVDAMNYYVDITIPEELLPDLYGDASEGSVTENFYIDLIYESISYYRDVNTIILEYSRDGGNRTLMFPCYVETEETDNAAQ